MWQIVLLLLQVIFILEDLQYFYGNLRDKNEIVIYDKYGNAAKLMTIGFISKKKTTCIYVCVVYNI